ncbi:hypothetical protein BRADI_3g38402v3 [Brachypodium distachyon]|uniref:Uncharacterized protein n=1 Tax=Brachypodium distachyon TaxID=15368 RepID=A0A2K2D1Y3_BRADI|nr:hypothetical protein BRADI_3g38402v3 [Brachypodium distachyon]
MPLVQANKMEEMNHKRNNEGGESVPFGSVDREVENATDPISICCQSGSTEILCEKCVLLQKVIFHLHRTHRVYSWTWLVPDG